MSMPLVDQADGEAPLPGKRAPSARAAPDQIRSVAAATIGNAFEYYDFFLYGTAAALVFNRLFFPAHDPRLGTLAAFATYAVGFVSRPLGGVVFGHIGDRYGRKLSMTWTLALMGAATFLIGLLPSYAQAGPLAPALLIALRLLQGFAAGGEWGGAILMATENAPEHRRGLFGAWSQAGIGLGFVLSGSALALAQQLGPDAFTDWGWRLPFLGSAIVVAGGLVIRARVPESREFVEGAGKRPDHPVRAVFSQHGWTVLLAGGLRLAEMSATHLMTTFALAFGQMNKLPSSLMLTGVTASMIMDTGVMLFFGHLSDRIGRPRVYIGGILALALFSYPFFMMLQSGSMLLVLAAFLIGNGVCHSAMIGPQPSLLTEIFPVEVRASALAMAQAIASVVMGFVPLMATFLFYRTGSVASVALMEIGFCLISLICVILAVRRARVSS